MISICNWRHHRRHGRVSRQVHVKRMAHVAPVTRRRHLERTSPSAPARGGPRIYTNSRRLFGRAFPSSVSSASRCTAMQFPRTFYITIKRAVGNWFFARRRRGRPTPARTTRSYMDTVTLCIFLSALIRARPSLGGYSICSYRIRTVHFARFAVVYITTSLMRINPDRGRCPAPPPDRPYSRPHSLVADTDPDTAICPPLGIDVHRYRIRSESRATERSVLTRGARVQTHVSLWHVNRIKCVDGAPAPARPAPPPQP
ncbi:hypothetical protein EVAR_9807_1 [Eumeta japonica]|uniref:Uncharacterized protein n=1 Tax=Eumeta variegata TaxID=151549 RepID=A0A4C1U5I9_EUMVA|nr:hypothetical protein EVAR_9807_1 [Eumeta japonica]